jgi:molybdopterin/thiamine biosynthesis adenylyltransferase
MTNDYFDRNERLFGKPGQERLRKLRVAIVGVGGLGSHLVQQLTLLGVRRFNLIDAGFLKSSHRNRYVTYRDGDEHAHLSKVDAGERLIRQVDPQAEVVKVVETVVSQAGFDAVLNSDVVFAGVDREGVRAVLNELCCAFDRPYFDLATEVIPGPPLNYGGRICVVEGGKGCLRCRRVLDDEEVSRDLAGTEQIADRAAVYGVDVGVLADSGPSVVSINGVVASLAVTEFMAFAADLREPRRLLTYYGNQGKVTVSQDVPAGGCWFCSGIRGKGSESGVMRYLGLGVATSLK